MACSLVIFALDGSAALFPDLDEPVPAFPESTTTVVVDVEDAAASSANAAPCGKATESATNPMNASLADDFLPAALPTLLTCCFNRFTFPLFPIFSSSLL
ncbi:hypothetical protein D3C81_1503120 [compost metagenome]